MASRDLRTYAEALGGSLCHYHDKSGLECDAVMRIEDGSYGLIEVKTGGETLIEKGAAALVELEGKIDTTRMKKPAFKMLLVADGEFAYRRKDGVTVCPISSLRP